MLDANGPWQPLASAPRDGSFVRLRQKCDPQEVYVMRWNSVGENPLVQEGRGIWEVKGGGCTWSEERPELGGAPDEWAPLLS